MKQRRPSIGRRIMHGILLIWQKMKINIENDFVPHWWSPEDRRDVRLAVEYLGKLYDWYIELRGDEGGHHGEEG